jgi:hypothetical protein
MAEQGGGRASWQEAFQPLQNGAVLMLPSTLYKPPQYRSPFQRFPFMRFEMVTSPPSAPFPLSPQSLS